MRKARAHITKLLAATHMIFVLPSHPLVPSAPSHASTIMRYHHFCDFVPFIYIFVTNAFVESGWIIKGFVYMAAFYLLELVAGLIIKALVGVSPWNYKNYRFHFKEVICLEYAPVWFIYGVVGEMYFEFLISI